MLISCYLLISISTSRECWDVLMEITFLSSAVRGTLETSLHKHAQASHLLAVKTSSHCVQWQQMRPQLQNKQVTSVPQQRCE